MKKIVIAKNGPYLISGTLPLKKEILTLGEEDYPESYSPGEKYPDKESYALCRCGESKTKPYCDGSHKTNGFDGTETADTRKYLEMAQKMRGQQLDLTDAQDLCASGRFCHKGNTWEAVQKSSDPKLKQIAIESACNCPSGRLVVWDIKTGKPIEPKFEQSISLLEDPQNKVSGPIWVKGGVQIESHDGTKYEIRNRMTICRCGKSGNKPFCDGTHVVAEFNDGDESLL